MSCDKCAGCGQFCDYPACMPDYVPPQPDPWQIAWTDEALIAWASAWATRHLHWDRHAG